MTQELTREPIMTSKAEIQTIYITTGYGWSQTDDNVVIYLSFKDANEVLENNSYSLGVLERSLELNIFDHHGVNYRFKLSYLYDFVIPEKSTIKIQKLKDDKITIKLFKQHVNKKWQDLSMKSMQSKYHEMERFVRQNDTNTTPHFETPFNADHICSKHHH